MPVRGTPAKEETGGYGLPRGERKERRYRQRSNAGVRMVSHGGKQNLKAEKCECLKGRNVILFPDLGAFDDWKEKGEAIARRVGFTLSVSDTLERIATPEDRRNGLDIADYMIRAMKTKN